MKDIKIYYDFSISKILYIISLNKLHLIKFLNDGLN